MAVKEGDMEYIRLVARSEQRGLYAERKRAAARAQGYVVLEIPWERRPRPPRRDRVADLALLHQ